MIEKFTSQTFDNRLKKGRTGKLFKTARKKRRHLLDAALLVSALLLVFTDAKIFFFHIIFLLLTFGAFFWRFRPFAIRASLWVLITLAVVLMGIVAGDIPAEELIEFPLLSAILVVVYTVARQRASAEEALRQTNEELENRVAERTADLTRANAELVREISKHERTEETLRESEERYRRLVKLSFEAIIIHVQGRLAYLNTPAAKLLGANSPGELIGKPMFDLIHPDYIDIVKNRFQQATEEGKGVPPVEEKLLRLDGASVDVEVAAIPITYEGQPAVQVVLRDITARKQAEVERERLLLAEREQRLLAETLGEVFLALTAQTSRKTVLDEILRQVQRIVSYSAANIALLKGDTLQIVRWQGYEAFKSDDMVSNLAQPLAEFPVDAGVILSRQPLVIPDTGQYPGWITLPETAWISSSIIVPICLGEHMLGLLRLDSDSPNKFSNKDIERLQPLANAAAIALENARLYDQALQELAERRRAEEEILELNRKLLGLQHAGATIASSLDLQYVLNMVTQEMVNLLEVEGCAISEWNQATDNVTVIVEQGHPGWWDEGSLETVYNLADYPLTKQVLLERRPRQMTINQPGIDPDELAFMKAASIKTLLMLPMEFQNRIVGLVEMMDDRAERVFTSDEIALAQLLANNAASAIENARLFEQAKKELAERKQIEKELRQIAAEKQAILDVIPDSIFRFSRDGRLLDYKVHDSHPSSGILGHMATGNHLRDLLPPELTNLTLHYIDQTLQTGAMQIFEYQLPQPQGTGHFEARLVVSGPNEVLAIVRDITDRKTRAAALEKERARIARDLHDSLGQNLGYLHLKLDELAGSDSLRTLEAEQQELARMREVASEAYELVRNMLAAARPSNSTDLATALLHQANAVSARARFEVHLATEGQPVSLSPIVQQQVLYILQEALSNVEKHANARRVDINLKWTKDILTITLSDDGCGFETGAPRPHGHFGLTIMQERAEELNGLLSITSNPDDGTELILWLPLNPIAQPSTLEDTLR